MCEATDRYEHVVKIVVVGDLAVGKSSIVARFTRNEFKVETLGTVNVNLEVGYAEIEGKIVKAQIWDTCGHERFRSVIRSYFHGASGFLLVYDISKRASYDSVRQWLKDIADSTDGRSVVMLVGNRSDLEDKRAVPAAEASELAARHGCLFIETSAFNSTNVGEAFQTLLTGVVSKQQQHRSTAVGVGEQSGAGASFPVRSTDSS